MSDTMTRCGAEALSGALALNPTGLRTGRARWRLAQVSSASHIDTPALMLTRALGVEVWRPIVRIRKRRGLRRRVYFEAVPVFGAYLFLRLCDDQIPAALALHVDGVPMLSRIVSGDVGVSVIPDAEISALRAAHAEGYFAARMPGSEQYDASAASDGFKSGQDVRVTRGLIEAMPGVVEAVQGDKAWVLVSLFGRANRVELPVSALEAAE